MFIRTLTVAASLLAASTSVAQIASTSYGSEVANSSMRMRLLASGDSAVDLVIHGGQPNAPVQLLIGFEQANVSLKKIGVNATLLVVPAFTSEMSTFNANGRFHAHLELGNAAAAAGQVFFQAASIVRKGVELSHGMSVKAEGAAQYKPKPQKPGYQRKPGYEPKPQKPDYQRKPGYEQKPRKPGYQHAPEIAKSNAAYGGMWKPERRQATKPGSDYGHEQKPDGASNPAPTTPGTVNPNAEQKPSWERKPTDLSGTQIKPWQKG